MRHVLCALLEESGIKTLVAGRFLSVFGGQALSVAVGWQIYERTNSKLALGIVGLVQLVPALVLVLPAGMWVDRNNRRNLLALAQAFLGLIGAGLAVTTFLHAPVWTLYALLFLRGVGIVLSAPAYAGLITQLVPRDRLIHTNAYLATSFQIASLTGPVFAGFLIDWLHTPGYIYALQACSSVGFAAMLMSIPRPADPVPKDEPAALSAGVRFVFGNPLLLGAFTLDLFAMLLGGVSALYPVFARDVLHVGARGLGWLQAAPALGAASMAIVTTRLPPWKRAGRMLFFSVAGYGVAILGFGLSQSFVLSLSMLFLSGVFDNISVVIRRTLEQVATPIELQGRVSSVHYVFISLSNELGEFESGVTAEWLGAVGSVLLGGAGTLAVVAIAWMLVPRLRNLGKMNEAIAD